MTNEEGQQLHDRATRGEPLTADERVALDQWYARVDAEEALVLARAPHGLTPAELQSRIATAAARLVETSRRIQVLTAENQELRAEIEQLRQQLARRAAQPA